jgi:hypothetical protein
LIAGLDYTTLVEWWAPSSSVPRPTPAATGVPEPGEPAAVLYMPNTLR